MKKSAAPIAPPRPIQTRAATSATPAANASMIGSSTSWNWGTPKSNSPWKVESPISRPPIANTRRYRATASTVPEIRPSRATLDGAWPSTLRIAVPIRVRPAPPIEHQVGRPPEGHVLAEDPMPDVVEWKADQREARGREHRDPAEWAYQSPAMRIARGLGLPSGSTIARNPAAKIAEQARRGSGSGPGWRADRDRGPLSM